jgi:uncharacterized protein (DUF1330 family)
MESGVPKEYWIARIDVSDPEAYTAYAPGAASPFARPGAGFLVRGGRFESVEGQARGHNAVIEFRSYEAALDCCKIASL